MTKPLPIMNQVELRNCEVTADEAGFGALETQRGMLPLREMSVDAEIVGLTARTTLRQTFHNPYDTRLEATYVFPLPARAAVRHFRMVVDGRVVEGEIEERGKARETYERAIQAGQRASIVEQERPNVFTIRVGNLAPGETAEIEFEMVGPLVFADGEATWRFPLVVAPRYVPGTPLGDDVGTGVAPDTDRVPDASRISPPVMLPGFPNPVALSMRVSVDGAGLPITDLRGSLPADIAAHGERQVVTIKPGQRLNQDCIIRYRTTADEVATALTFAPDAEGEAGTFELTVMPGQPQLDARKPRDVVFVLDRSGSMGGWKMVAARRAMARMVDTLTPSDRFTVIAFDTVNEVPDDHGTGLVSATNRNRWKSVEFLARVDARGGTNLDFAIEEAINRAGEGYQDRERQIIVVTDGQVSQESAVLELVRTRGSGIRFFTVGIDRAVNASLLGRMAEYGGGHCELVESDDRLDAVMDTMHKRMDAVVVEELGWSFRGLEVEANSVAPGRVPALFAGAPAVIRGRATRTGGEIVAELSGISGRKAWKTAVPGVQRSEPAVSAMWARHRLINLEDEYDATGQQSLIETMTSLSLKHRVLCRFTAFVAVDTQGDPVDTEQELHQVNQLVEQPEGWAGSVPMAPPSFAAAPAPRQMAAAPQGLSAQTTGGVGGAAPGGMKGGGSDGFGGEKSRRRSGLAQAPSRKEKAAIEDSFDELSLDDEFASERAEELSPTLGKVMSDVRLPATATEFDVRVAILVYLVSGAWTLEHLGLDMARAESVLGQDVMRSLRADLRGALNALTTASAMMPDGSLMSYSASYSIGEAASVVSRLAVGDPEEIAQSDYEDLEIRAGNLMVAVGRSRSFWK